MTFLVGVSMCKCTQGITVYYIGTFNWVIGAFGGLFSESHWARMDWNWNMPIQMAVLLVLCFCRMDRYRWIDGTLLTFGIFIFDVLD